MRWALSWPLHNQTVAGFGGKQIVLRSIRDGTIVKELGTTDGIPLHLCFLPNGRRLASADQNGSVILWSVETGNEILRYYEHEFWVLCARFSRDGRVLASSQGGRWLPPQIRFRHAATEEEARRLLAD